MKNATSTEKQHNNKGEDSPTIASQATSISQLTEQVNKIKQMNKMFLTRFNQLAEQMAALLAANTNNPPTQCPAGGHNRHESGAAT